MKKIKIFVLNSLVLLASSIILQIIGMFFNVYISNKIGSEAVGIFTLVMSVYLFGITLATSGINIASTRIISEELAYNNHAGVKSAARKCIIISLITGILASLIFFVFCDFIVVNCLHNRVSHKVIYALSIALPFISMCSAINGYFVAVRRAYKNAINKFFEEFVKIASTAFILNIFMPSGLDYMCFSLILADVISEVFSFIFAYFLFLKDKNNLEMRSSNQTSYTKRVLRISVAFTSYIRSGLSTLKQIITPIALERSGIGCSLALSNYGIVNGMAMPVIMFPSVFINCFASLLVPEFSRYFVKNDTYKIRKMSIFILSVTLAFSIFVTAIIFYFAEPLADLLYNQKDIAKYIKILAFLIPFIYLDLVIDNILKGLDAQVSVVFVNIADCLLTISFIYFVVPRFGFIGYILSIFVSEIFNIVLSFGQLLLILHKHKIKNI